MRAERILQVFQWPSHYPIRLVLPAALVISLLVHASAVYLFRPAVAAPAPRASEAQAKVLLVPSSSGSALLDARDPSWLEPGRFRDRILGAPHAVRPRRALDPRLPDLVPPAPEARGERWAPSLPPLADRPRFERREAAPAPAVAPVSARFDGEGPPVPEDFLARLRVAASAVPPGLATELLVALDAAGDVRHVWLVRSCGAPQLDLAAQLAVQRSRFRATGAGHEGVLRVVWGPGESAP